MGASDKQVGGDHYRLQKVQQWDAQQAWMTPEMFRGSLKGNAIKYLSRVKGDELEDIKKAIHHLEKLVEVMEAEKGRLQKLAEAERLITEARMEAARADFMAGAACAAAEEEFPIIFNEVEAPCTLPSQDCETCNEVCHNNQEDAT